MDVDRLRTCFPALARNADFVFADNAGGSQVLEGVVKQMGEYMLGSNVQMADYPYARRAEKLVANGTAAAALFAGTKPENIMFGASATQLFETLTRLIEAKTLAEQKSGEEAAAQAWRPQDEIIVTSVDHEANRGAWLRLAERLNLSVKTWQPSRLPHATHPTHVTLSLDGLRALVTPRTRLVAFTAASNVLGSHFTDVELQQIVQTVRESSEGKAYVAVDAVAFAPHMRLRPEVWGVDFVVWSWYKVFGAHVGSMYLSPRSRAETGILGKLNHHFLHGLQGTMYNYQPSSVQYELVVSVAAVVDYLLWVGSQGTDSAVSPPSNDYATIDVARASASLDECYRRISQQEQLLASTTLTRLQAIPGLSILGDAQPSELEARAPTVAFYTAAKSSKQLHRQLVQGEKVGAQQGHMYAYALMVAVSPPLQVEDGVVRVSFVHYNTLEEVNKVCDMIAQAVATD